MKTEDRLKVLEAERIMEYDKWVKEIPFISFDSNWQVKVIPPFCLAVCRFQIKKGDAFVSVYLDCYDNIGIFGAPYWEIYPYDDDVYRVEMNNVDELMLRITESINQQT